MASLPQRSRRSTAPIRAHARRAGDRHEVGPRLSLHDGSGVAGVSPEINMIACPDPLIDAVAVRLYIYIYSHSLYISTARGPHIRPSNDISGACDAGNGAYLGSGLPGSPENRYNLLRFRGHPGNSGLTPSCSRPRSPRRPSASAPSSAARSCCGAALKPAGKIG